MTGQVHRAGRLILAIADDDLSQTVKITREAAEEPGGVMALIVAMASVAIASARAVSGEEWRAALVTALNVLEIDGEAV